MPEPMRIAERSLGDVTILELEGRLVTSEGELVLRDAINGLVEQGRVKIVIDMRNVTRIDSAGIGMIASKCMTANRQGGTVKLLHLTPQGQQLMRVTKLHSVFEIFESEDEAVRSFSSSPGGNHP